MKTKADIYREDYLPYAKKPISLMHFRRLMCEWKTLNDILNKSYYVVKPKTKLQIQYDDYCELARKRWIKPKVFSNFFYHIVEQGKDIEELFKIPTYKQPEEHRKYFREYMQMYRAKQRQELLDKKREECLNQK